MTFSDPLLTKADVAKLLRCCERTLERQVRLNAFPPPQRFGKEALWFQSVVFGWLEQRRERQRQWSATNEPAPVEAAAKAPDDIQHESEATTPKPRASRAKPRRSQAALQSVFTPEQLSRIGKAVPLD